MRHFCATAYIIDPETKKILLVKHKDLGRWTQPGGHIEHDEFPEEAAVREAYEETGIVLNPDDIILIDTLSGESRKNVYPNGDIVYNNTSLYLADVNIDDISSLKHDSETKSLRFFSVDNIPLNFMDFDLIEAYKNYIKSKTL